LRFRAKRQGNGKRKKNKGVNYREGGKSGKVGCVGVGKERGEISE
jgi:hypothetical protein